MASLEIQSCICNSPTGIIIEGASFSASFKWRGTCSIYIHRNQNIIYAPRGISGIEAIMVCHIVSIVIGLVVPLIIQM